jgi:hypothetical protein
MLQDSPERSDNKYITTVGKQERSVTIKFCDLYGTQL